MVNNDVELSDRTSVLDRLSSHMGEIINFIHIFPGNEIFQLKNKEGLYVYILDTTKYSGLPQAVPPPGYKI